MKTIKTVFSLAAAVLLVACTTKDITSLKERMDGLESRISALETQVNTLNKNVEGYQALLNAGTINSVTEKDGVYTIVLSNGKTLTINQGSVGVGNVPVMSIDSEGYWMVDYQDGKGAVYVLYGGNKVKATGEDGQTPKFGVDANGYWTVSYDGGDNYEQVKNSAGKPVSAIPSGDISDPYFNSVNYNETTGIFTLELKNGTALTIPVVADFLCSISGADAVQTFLYAETKNFPVEMKGVAQTILTCPSGWDAGLTGTILSVTAPKTPGTKAALADTRTDVSILALSGSGYAAVAKVKVQLSDIPIPVNPTAAIVVGTATPSSISFSVNLSDSDSWKYKVLAASTAAPSAESINSEGSVGQEGQNLVEGLDEETEYMIYVLPIKGTVMGAVTSASMTTTVGIITDYYQAWQDGKDIVIAGKIYNKASNGEGSLLSATAADTDFKSSIHQQTGVFFLEASEGASFTTPTTTEITQNVVLIGRYPGSKVTYKPGNNVKLKSGSFVLLNINVDTGALTNYWFNNANSTADFTNLHFDGCCFSNLKFPLLYANIGTNGFASIKVVNSVLLVQPTFKNGPIFNRYNTTVLDHDHEFVFDDNIVCSPAPNANVTSIINYNQTLAQDGTH